MAPRHLRILVIEDNRNYAVLLERRLLRLGHQARICPDLQTALNTVEGEKFDIVLLDVVLPDGNGIDAIPLLKEKGNGPEIIVMTGQPTLEGAEKAVLKGAWDYIEKPAQIGQLLLPLSRVVQYQEEKRKTKQIIPLKREGLIGASRPFQRCLEQLSATINSDMSVLITGETGVGKERICHTIHQNSLRQSRELVVVDCASLTETLVESTLFGHEKYAFTGANERHIGLIGLAHGSTLFLDEVSEMPLSIQKKFLRVLQERRYRPVGSKIERDSNFRILSATNKRLEHLVEEGKFRKDLLFRLNSFVIEVPPLRDRKDDIKELVFHFVNQITDQLNIPSKGISPDVYDLLSAYHWPGNVRELKNMVEVAISSAIQEPILFPVHFPSKLRVLKAQQPISTTAEETRGRGTGHSVRYSISPENLPTYKTFRQSAFFEIEKEYLVEVLRKSKGCTERACSITNLKKSRLYQLLKVHGLKANKT